MAGLLILLLIGCVTSVPQGKVELVNKLLRGVEKAADFFRSDYANINADGIFGLRIGQGQLVQTIEDCEQRQCDEDVLARVRHVVAVVEDTVKSAEPYVERLDPKYYRRFFPFVKQPYIVKYRPHTFRHLQSVVLGEDTSYNEEEGDACFSRLLGTYEENGHFIPKCNTTDYCIKMMTKPGTAEYVITHQLFYFIIMEEKGCDKVAGQKITAKTLRGVEEKLCKIIYKEAETLWKDKEIYVGKQDLFMEQNALCGVLGFENFMRRDWMKTILGWQTHEGCYKSVKPLSLFKEEFTPHKLPKKKQMRQLLREAPMSGDCLSHKTGLGFGSLSMFLRYLIRTS